VSPIQRNYKKNVQEKDSLPFFVAGGDEHVFPAKMEESQVK